MKLKIPVFRPSKSDNDNWNLAKTLVHTTFFWLIFLYLIPMAILKIESTVGTSGFATQNEIGWILFILFSLLGIYSGFTMSWEGKGTPLPLDCPNKLVVKGPYQFVRNPMAIAGIGQGICVGIIVGSYAVILYAVSGAFLWHIIVKPMEETDLEQRFGKSYIEYKRDVKCWVPRFITKTPY